MTTNKKRDSQKQIIPSLVTPHLPHHDPEDSKYISLFYKPNNCHISLKQDT